MALVEIARFYDVYEAEVAASFLRSQGIDIFLTEKHQTTIDPLMQRALGIRLLAHPSHAEEARALVARARVGEFAEDDGDPTDAIPAPTRAAGTVMALMLAMSGGFASVGLPRRLNLIHWIGFGLIAALTISLAVVLARTIL